MDCGICYYNYTQEKDIFPLTCCKNNILCLRCVQLLTTPLCPFCRARIPDLPEKPRMAISYEAESTLTPSPSREWRPASLPLSATLDEAYIDFASEDSFTKLLDKYPNLLVMQTFSKAWGLASLRLGMAFASEEFIKILNKIKYPYNLNGVTQKLLYTALGKVEKKDKFVKQILKERERLHKKLSDLSIVMHIFPSDSNQLLVKFIDANLVFQNLIEQKIITRLRSSVILCEECIRISVGTKKENDLLLKALKKY